nr:hypothetical protein [Pseudomonas sp. URIL14HWK12:I5]
MDLPYPTNDTLLLTRAATTAVVQVYRPGHQYSKAVVLLMDLRQSGDTADLFAMTQLVACDRLMSVLDEMNGIYGRGDDAFGQRPPALRLEDAARDGESLLHNPD